MCVMCVCVYVCVYVCVCVCDACLCGRRRVGWMRCIDICVCVCMCVCVCCAVSNIVACDKSANNEVLLDAFPP